MIHGIGTAGIMIHGTMTGTIMLVTATDIMIRGMFLRTIITTRIVHGLFIKKDIMHRLQADTSAVVVELVPPYIRHHVAPV